MEFKRQFGLHFDFHAKNEYEIGERTRIEEIEQYIIDTNPDFIQCDCKGHPGLACYPTKVGTPAARLKADNLRVWCEAAKKHNIPIYVHYSGVWDIEYINNHPEDAELNEKGERYDNSVSLFGKYDDKLLIPQLKELIREYGINGAWIDGEVWAVHRDYSDNIKPYLYEGITVEEHNKIMREAFLRHVKKYTDELHAFEPEFKVMSNWLYSSYIPEKPEIDVDFLSGDFVPNDSAHAARFEARCLAVQGKKWDLMSWSFSSPFYAEKPAVQLMQEAAVVLSLGGGFQIYVMQNRDGSARRYTNGRFKQVSRFARDRQMLYGKAPTAQIGLLYSADSYYKKSDVFNSRGHFDHLVGALGAMLDAQYTVNILLEYQLDNISDYDIIAVPQWEFISDENKQKLLSYAESGGNLIVIGAECCRQFAELSGADCGEIVGMPYAYLCDENGLFVHFGQFIDNQKTPDLKIPVLNLKNGQGGIYSSPDPRDRVYPAYRTDHLKKGTVTFIPFSFGSLYFEASGFVLKSFIKEVLNGISAPFAEINRTGVDLTMLKAENGVILNLINMQQGRHSLNSNVYDEVPPIYGIELKINKIYKNVQMPLGEKFTCEVIGNNTTLIKIEKLDIHSILLLED